MTALACAMAVSACGRPRGSTDVAAFVRQGSTPAQQAILHSIGIYRTTHDYRLACSLITDHFLRSRFDGQERGCEELSREAPRVLPRSGRVVSVASDTARVRIRELTATESIYVMRRVGPVWKIDDIVEARPTGS